MNQVKRFQLIILSLFTGIGTPLAAMENTPTPLFVSPTKSKVFFPNIENDGGLKIVTESLKKTGPEDTIFADLFVLTDVNLAQTLVDRKKAGTEVSINLCNSMKTVSKKAIDILEKGSITVNLFNPKSAKKKEVAGNRTLPQTLHKKVIGWTYHDPLDNQIHYRTFHGSRNPSYMTQSFENKNTNVETMAYEVDQPTFDEFQKMHKYITNAEHSTPEMINYDQNSPLKKTPQSKKTIVSYKNNICSTVAKRIANTQVGGKIWLAIYALNYSKIMDEIKKVNNQDSLEMMILDQGCLKNNETRNFLKELQNNNNNNNDKIYVYNITKEKRVGRCPTQFHAKAFVRQQPTNNKYLVGLGSTNFTTASNNDINNWTWYPQEKNNDNTEMAEDIIAGLNEFSKECTPLSQALTTFDEQQKQEAAKKPTKKKRTDNKTTSNKKQKTASKKLEFKQD